MTENKNEAFSHCNKHRLLVFLLNREKEQRNGKKREKKEKESQTKEMREVVFTQAETKADVSLFAACFFTLQRIKRELAPVQLQQKKEQLLS